MKKQITISLLLLLTVLTTGAQTSMRQVFEQMPDSLLPSLSKNNRLDMLDFMEAKMRAEVDNLLECPSEMTALSADSLTVVMSPVLTVKMRLLSTETEYDSLHQVVVVEHCYSLPSDDTSETVRTFYSLRWNRIDSLAPVDRKLLAPLPPSSILKPDEILIKAD
jgi:hypothetical protein